MGCFPKPHEVPDQVVEFVRHAVELLEHAVTVCATGRTPARYRALVQQRCGMRYGGRTGGARVNGRKGVRR